MYSATIRRRIRIFKFVWEILSIKKKIHKYSTNLEFPDGLFNRLVDEVQLHSRTRRLLGSGDLRIL